MPRRAPTFGVAARHDARASRRAAHRPRAPQLVHRALQRRIELGVVHRQADLARKFGEHTVVLFSERHRTLDPRDHDDAEELAGVTDGGDAHRAERAAGERSTAARPTPTHCPIPPRAR